MPVSNQIAQARLDYFRREEPTRVDIRPEVKEADGFFGPDGLSFGDVLDAINPLNHIPIVSDIYANLTGNKASLASKLVGGTLLGGPIGFVASLANVIFEDSTGKSPAMAAYAALRGQEDDSTKLAQAPTPEDANASEPAQLASLAPSNAPASVVNELLAVSDPVITTALTAKDKAVLELYGNSQTSAHESYRRAQLRPYLQDVSVSRVL